MCKHVRYKGQGTWGVQADEAKKTMTLMWNVTEGNLAKNATSEIFAPADLFFQVRGQKHVCTHADDVESSWHVSRLEYVCTRVVKMFGSWREAK